MHPRDSPLERVTLIKDFNQGSIASSHQLLKKYMHIQSINGVSLDNKDLSQAANIIQETDDSEVQLMVRSSRRDLVKVERKQKQSAVQHMESPMREQREQFALVNKHPDERVVSTPRVSTISGDFGGSVGSDGSITPVTPGDDVFKHLEHKKPTDLRGATGCITGVRQRGDKFDEFRWEVITRCDTLVGGEGSLGLSLTLVDFVVSFIVSE